jgi:hypothetical protein
MSSVNVDISLVPIIRVYVVNDSKYLKISSDIWSFATSSLMTEISETSIFSLTTRLIPEISACINSLRKLQILKRELFLSAANGLRPSEGQTNNLRIAFSRHETVP